MGRRVLIVEDHPLVATGLRLALTARDWEVETAEVLSVAGVMATAESFLPDCALVDLHLGDIDASGLDLIRPLCESGISVVVLTAETDRYVLASCVEAGADGWIGKNAFLDEIVRAIEDVLAGRQLLGKAAREALLDELRVRRASLTSALTPFERLTPRERVVLGALVSGSSAEEIADTHYVALTTIRSQIRAILQKLGVRSQLAAVAYANRVKWVPPPAEDLDDRAFRQS
jgi:DNA-binding NarL/FixJ family response regulator